MRPNPSPEAPGGFEKELRGFWSSRRLPEPSGHWPAPSGGATLLFLTPPLTPGAESAPASLERLLLLDVAARYARLTGRGVRPDVAGAIAPPASAALDDALDRLGIWTGRNARVAPLTRPEAAGLQRAVDRLAESGVLRASTVVQRYCPTCAEVRTPQRVRYREELGRAYLVRVPLDEPAPAASLIVWTEAVWKLLATSAVLVNPDLPYVRAKFRRRGFEEQIVIARAALPRLEEWMPGGVLEVLEERPGSSWAGKRYRSPLADSVPSMRDTSGALGTVLATPEVNGSGTGIVTLTPSHGPADAQLGATLHLPGPDVLGPDGLVAGEPRHKFTGLPLDTAEACVLRELLDDGFVFAELRVRRGVPHCQLCGEPTIWRPGSAWGLDLANLPTGVGELFARLLPEETLPAISDLLAWPVSDGRPSAEPDAPQLMHCPACGRLSPSGFRGTCRCGQAAPVPVRQRLRPPFEEPIAGWLRLRAAGPAGATWLFLPTQRRAPELLHLLLAAWATGPLPGRELVLHSLSALPPDAGTPVSDEVPADAIRLALLRSAQGSNVRRQFTEALAEETRWVRRFWSLARGLEEELSGAKVPLPPGSASLRVGELLPEDLALVARFERLRSAVLADYEQGRWEHGISRLTSFLDRELRDGYLRLTRPRRLSTSAGATRLAVHRVLAYLLGRLSELLAPVMPFTAEAMHRESPEGEQSLFELRIAPVQEALLDADAERSLPTWEGLVSALERARDSWGVGHDEPVPQLVLVALHDEDSARLLPQLPVIARLVGALKVEVYGPSRPWTQRRVSIRFDRDALRQAFPVYHRRILSVLETLDPRRVREAARSQTLAVALEGQPAIRVPASMVEVVETLPERFVAFNWPGGEAYAELPARVAESRAAPADRLTPDLERIAAHIRRRLRAGGTPAFVKGFLYVPDA
ncbi:MAG TPA: class I tRNA ligase family protein, partial [Thermoplasmata archaeon]|nr:class I tRNA ligase family protein [Thermoplasmata archaeon]